MRRAFLERFSSQGRRLPCGGGLVSRAKDLGGIRLRPTARGFTLLEILITIALMGLLASVLIVGSTRLMSEQPVTPEDIFRKAVNDARKTAVETNVEVRLAFDPKEKVFTSSTPAGAQTYAVSGPDDLAFDFLAAQKGGRSVLVAGAVFETQTLPFVTFYPDGTCTPFRLQLRVNGNVRVIAIDPWTCAPVLESEKK